MTKILIVEDDFVLAANIEAMLKREGFSTRHSPDGLDAVKAAADFRPDVVLLDLMIPHQSGFDVCRKIRSDAKTKNAKILVTTGLDKTSDVERAFSSGASDYLIKPFDRERLLKKLAKLLGKPE